MDEGGSIMKKFHFNLEKLLSYKGQMLDSELTTLASLNSQLSEAQQRLDRLETEKETCKIDFEKKIKVKTTPAACQMYLKYQEHLKDQMGICRKEIEFISNRLDRQIETIKKLKLETKSLETIKTSRFDEYRKEGLKDEELRIEEFVSTASIIHKTF